MLFHKLDWGNFECFVLLFSFNWHHESQPTWSFYSVVKASFCPSTLWLIYYSSGPFLLELVFSLWTSLSASNKGFHCFRNWGVSKFLPGSKSDASVSGETNPWFRAGRLCITGHLQTPEDRRDAEKGLSWDIVCWRLEGLKRRLPSFTREIRNHGLAPFQNHRGSGHFNGKFFFFFPNNCKLSLFPSLLENVNLIAESLL